MKDAKDIAQRSDKKGAKERLDLPGMRETILGLWISGWSIIHARLSCYNTEPWFPCFLF
jgi:hypothetical protein